MASQFDDIAEKYQEITKDNAPHIYTMVSLLPYESLKGKTVLDLACGTGVFCRIAAELGAESVIGVDISSEMINIGKMIEEKAGDSKIQYIVKDVVDIGKLGEFDVVWASFLIPYAENIDNLKQMIQVVYNNLKPGSRFITLVPQPVVGDSWPPDNAQLRKYGKTKKLISTNEPQDGDKIIVTLYSNDGSEVNMTNYWYSHKTLLEVFEETGFVNIKFQNLLVKPEEYFKEGGKEYWRYFLEHPDLVSITAEKN